MRRILALFRSFTHGKQAERDLDEEIRAYMAMSVEERMAQGMSKEDASRAVRLASGGHEQTKESVRDARTGTPLHQFSQDFRYALRSLRHSPGFAAVAIVTIALGIGANTAIFSLFDAVLLRSLPVAEPQQLFLVKEISPRDHDSASLSRPGFDRLRKSLPAGAQLIGLAGPTRFNMASGSGGIEPLSGQLISGDYFKVLGIQPFAGRLIEEQDDLRPAASPVAVLSYNAWQKRFGGDLGTLGSTIRVNGATVTIIGVAEPGFYGVALGSAPEVWLPLMMQHEVRYLNNVASHNGDATQPWAPQENLYWIQPLARVAPPASEASVGAALSVAFKRELELTAERQGLARDRRLVLEPGSAGFTDLRRGLETPLKILLGMVALVLVIACANIANLLLARGSARQREFAVRLSLCASRARLLRQLLTESLVLSLIGGLASLLLVMWAMPLLPRILNVPVTLQVDHRLLLFAALASIATGLFFGAIPAIRSTRPDLSNVMKSGATGSTGRMRQTLGKSLVISQIALSLFLVTGAVLLGRSMIRLLQSDLGFDREHIVTVVIDPQSAALPEATLPVLYQRLIERVRQAPGVLDATISMSSIAGGGSHSSRIHVPGYTPQPSERPGTLENFVSPGYFALMGMRLLQGRDFDERDRPGTTPVAVINEAFARRYFSNRNPIGLRYGYNSSDPGVQLIGVVADAKIWSPKQTPRPMTYRPLPQEMRYARSLEVRTGGDPRAVASQLRRIVADVEPNLPVIEVATLSDRVEGTLRQERLLFRVSSFFALLALLLACVGLYGLMAYRVARRTGELGIRMALGAGRMQMIWIVLQESLVLLAAGLACGLMLSLAGNQLLTSLLYGLSPRDPMTFILAALLLSAVAILAAYLPALRASRVDPAVALRHE